MDKNYQIKYFKYKTKYLNLCKNILTNSKHENNNNKLNFNQIGGANINILFSCTSFNDASTLDQHFNLINDKINELRPSDSKKAICITLDDTTKIPITSPLVQRMIENDYNPSLELIKEPLMTYITELMPKETSIDVLVLAQCDDFVKVFINECFTTNIVSHFRRMNIHINEVVDFSKEFEIFKNNLFIIYNSLNQYGYIINIYYDESIFTNIENSLPSFSYIYILLHKMCCELFNKLFIKIENEIGIYSKNISITEPEYINFYDEIKKRNISEFFKIFANIKDTKEDTEEVKYNKICEQFIPNYISGKDLLGEAKIKQIVKFYTAIDKTKIKQIIEKYS